MSSALLFPSQFHIGWKNNFHCYVSNPHGLTDNCESEMIAFDCMAFPPQSQSLIIGTVTYKLNISSSMEIRWDDHRRDSLQRLILRVNCLPRIEKTISKERPNEETEKDRQNSQRVPTYFVGESIIVQLTSCLTGLDLTKQVNMLLN